MTIGQAVRASRLSRKLTQAEVAEQAGVSRQAVGLLENSGGRISTLLAIQPFAPVQLHGLPPGQTFGDRVRVARGERSLAEMARLSGVAINTIRAIEEGGGTVDSLARIIGALAPKAAFRPVAHRVKMWRSVHGRTNPNRAIEDYYASPAPIVRILLDNENFAGRILEPCLGEARVIEHVLHERGYNDVVCFDIAGHGDERRDFFSITEQYDAIVTNPPFRHHVAFIRHARKVARHKIALLLPLNYLTGKSRHDEVWMDRDFPLARVLIMSRGVNFLTNDPFADRLLASQLYCAWFVFDRHHLGPPTMQWLDNHPLIERGK